MEGGIDAWVNGVVAPLAAALSSVIFYTVPVLGADLPLVVLWLVAGGVLFTARFRFINFRGFGEALRLVRGNAGTSDAGHDEPELNKLFRLLIKREATNLHLRVEKPPYFRIDGELHELQMEPITEERMKQLCFPLMDERSRKNFERYDRRMRTGLRRDRPVLT